MSGPATRLDPVAVGFTYADAEGFKGGPDVADRTPSTYASSYKTYGGGVGLHHRPGPDGAGGFMYVDEDLRDVTTNVAGRHHGHDDHQQRRIVAVFSTRLDF